MSCAAARSIAVKLYAETRLGRDPASEREEALAAQDETFGGPLPTYLERRRERLRPRSLVEKRRHLLVNANPLHRLPLAKTGRRDIARLIAEIGVSSGPGAANDTLKDISAYLAWCMREGLVDVNAAAGANRFPHRSRERALTDDEIVRIWQATADDSDYSALVQLLGLTGARRRELGDLRWDELDLDAGRITLPPERTKTGKPFVIPLSPPALAILKARRVERSRLRCPWGTAWAAGKAALDKRSGTSGWRLHDWRRTLSTRLHEDLNGAPHLVEAILGHAIGGGGISSVYNRSTYFDERRRLLCQWADHLLAIAEGRESKIVILRA